MHFVNRRSLKWLGCCICGVAMLSVLAGCSHDDGDVGGAVKLGTDKLPQAPNQGEMPKGLTPGGQPTSNPGGGLPLPGNKGKH